MNFKQVVTAVLESEAFIDKPPVLVDIGAARQIHPEWSPIAAHSVCIAFDADSRDFTVSPNDDSYLNLHRINAIVSDSAVENSRFYLTSSSHCSSSLQPLNKSLEGWSFFDLFRVERVVDVKNISLADALREKGITYVDWFKTDSQGMDLRLFKALGDRIQRGVLVAEFEPGFIDAYGGEDKISHLLPFMEQLPFWMSDCAVKGSQRINKTSIEKYALEVGRLNLRSSPCWAEISYIHTCDDLQAERDLLLVFLFSCIKQQYGFALDVLTRLEGKTGSELFGHIEKFALNQLRTVEQPTRKGFIDRLKKGDPTGFLR